MQTKCESFRQELLKTRGVHFLEQSEWMFEFCDSLKYMVAVNCTPLSSSIGRRLVCGVHVEATSLASI